MKSIKNKIWTLSLFVAGVVSLTGCIEETEPTSVATESQIAQSSSATEALLMAMPAYFNDVNTSMVDDNSWHAPFGYPSMMIIRDLLTGDYGYNTSSYTGHFSWAAKNQYMGDGYLYGQYRWNFYYGFIQTANNLIGGVNEATATKEQLGYLGVGYAFRAMLYLDLARMYEFLPNEKTNNINADGHDVLNLTVPIVKAGMSQDAARNNPRATREDMAKFIEEDLNAAEKHIVNLTSTQNHVLPDLACVYGLKARLYMWLEKYDQAAGYARAAINEYEGGVMSKDTALDPVNGFNTAAPFMWCGTQTSEDNSVQTGIVNFISWQSNQTTFGYTGTATGVYVMVDKNMYDRISDTDFRKLWFQAPEGSPLRDQIKYLTPSDKNDMPAYAALKFRPAKGDAENYSTGAASSYPVMRIEEMYFIEAEATAHGNANNGLDLLKEFMKKRDPNYQFVTTDKAEKTEKDAIINEIVFQKRVELWGEGQTFYDVKRLNMSVTRGYEGSPFFDLTRLNTEGRPAWMNLVIIRTESNNNKALEGWNNPDPSDLYTPWVAE